MTDRRRHADRDRAAFAELMREVEARADELQAFTGRTMTPADRRDLIEFIRLHVSGGTRADAIGWAKTSFIGKAA